MKRGVMFSLIIAGLIAAMIHYRYEGKLNVPHIEDVASIQLIPAYAGAGAKAIELNLDDSRDIEVIVKVLNWLKASTVAGKAKNQFVSHGGSPTDLRFKLKNGDEVDVFDAIAAVSTSLENGDTLTQGQVVQDQVTVYQKNKAQRIIAPELKVWMREGWKQEPSLAMISKEDAVRIALGSAGASNNCKWNANEPSRGVNYWEVTLGSNSDLNGQHHPPEMIWLTIDDRTGRVFDVKQSE